MTDELSAKLAEDLAVYGMWIAMLHSDGTATRVDPTQFYLDAEEESC